MDELVSIIMPVYNSEKSLKRSISSVLNQTYTNIELIIVNDASTDNSLKICESFEDSRIKIYSKTNGGPSSARNFGIDKATGKYLMFIDSDDTYEADIVNALVNLKQKYDWVCCNFKRIKYGKIIKKDISSYSISSKKELKDFFEFLYKNILFNIVWNKIYERNIVIDNNIRFDNNIHFGEDLEFNIEYMKYISNAYFCDLELYNYYIEGNSISSKYRENDFETRIHNVEKIKLLYLENQFDDSFIIKLYIEMIIQSFSHYIENDKYSYKKIKKLLDIIEDKKYLKKCNFDKFEERLVYNLVIRKRGFALYVFLRYRCFLRRIKLKLLV